MQEIRAGSLMILLGAAVGLAAAGQAAKPAVPPGAPSSAAAIDAMAAAMYKSDAPGAAAIVVKDGRVVLRKAYGMADLELSVPMRPEFVFRLGSVTKQFTSTAIMMLAEQGKLSVNDEITKFLPDYPTQGRRITVEHLLTHTSGIKSYTNMDRWMPLMTKDLKTAELIDVFKNEPMEFEPGERWAYNNSGYFLLGVIVEKVTGTPYADFIQKQIFDPLGMTHSYYGDHARVIPLRISGYAPGPGGFVNAQYLSMTQPYAAGALLSSVDDLALWDAAVSAGKLLKPESWARVFTEYKLKDGRPSGYGYGWSVTTYEGRRVQEHGGGIPGFSTFVLRMPEERLYVAVLSNNVASTPSSLARRIAALAIGKPLTCVAGPAVDAQTLGRYAGTYGGGDEQIRLALQDGRLVLQGGGPPRPLTAASRTEFCSPEGVSRYTLQLDDTGEVIGLLVSGWAAPRTLKKVVRREAAVDPAIYDAYAGEYELRPGFVLTVTREANRLMTQATGQGKVEVFPESETSFFLKVAEAQITFVKEGGKVTGLVLRQNGREIKAAKIK